MEAIFHNCSRGTKTRGGVVNLALIAACCDVSVPLKEHGAAPKKTTLLTPPRGGRGEGAFPTDAPRSTVEAGRELEDDLEGLRKRERVKGAASRSDALPFWEGPGRNTCPTWHHESFSNQRSHTG